MPSYLLETSVLLRLSNPRDPRYAVTEQAVETLFAGGDRLYIAAQSLYELWVVATRPIAVNGLGLTAVDAKALREQFEALCPMLRDVPAIYDYWTGLVDATGTLGKPAHDTRLVAAMLAHGLTQILTWNAADFRRYEDAAIAGITVVEPDSIRPPAPGTR